MSRREFQFTDDKSNKFWAITLEENAHTVEFGRVGTKGQSKRKEFGSAAEAQASYDKLVREKMREGYVEIGSAPAPAPVAANPSPAAKKAAPKKAEEPAPESAPAPVAAPAEPAPAPVVISADVPRTLDLLPTDWLWVEGREVPKPQLPPTVPFDKEACLARARKAMPDKYTWQWSWERAALSPSMTREEAHFWLWAMTQAKPGVEKADELLPALAMGTYDGHLTSELIRARVEQANGLLSAEMVLVLSRLMPADELLELMLEQGTVKRVKSVNSPLIEGFREYLQPYLTADQMERLRAKLRGMIDPKGWPTGSYDQPGPAFKLAPYVGGLKKELLALVESWPDDLYTKESWRAHYQQPILSVLGLGDPQLVIEHRRRLKLALDYPLALRGWLAITGYSALEDVRDCILAQDSRETATTLVEELSRVHAPEAAPIMLELRRSSKAPKAAGVWFEQNPAHAALGLAPVAAGKGALAEAAVEHLRMMKRTGHEALVRQAVEALPAEAAVRVRTSVLEYVERVIPPLDPLPQWMKDALPKPAKATAWVKVADLPPLVVEGKRVQDEQVALVLAAIKESTLEKPHALVAGLRAHGEPDSRDRFAWKLFELWLGEGAPSKEKWAMTSVGLLGTDTSALKLTPMVRAWPGENQHQRAVHGLECLRGIGTDTALMQLNGIAQKLKFKGLKQRAVDLMDDIARDRGMSRSQLEDRIVPDCDLDERGGRTFDFGPRKFHFLMGPELKPVLRDEAGKTLSDLPKPNAKDDATLSAAAVEEWKLLKKQVKEVAKIQAERLEQAMVTGRRWTPEEFDLLLARHPLMTHLVRLLVWGGWDETGKLVATFRVTEDQTFADSSDDAFRLDGLAKVGVVHPLDLSAEQKAAWGQVFGDYEIISPFEQLGRPLFSLEPAEASLKSLDRLKGVEIPAPSLVGTLERLGWQRGIPQDAGVFYEHSKPFYGANVTAVVTYDGVPVGGFVDWDDQSVEKCFFIPGIYTAEMYPSHEKQLPLGEVPPVVLSEVLKDLQVLGEKRRT